MNIDLNFGKEDEVFFDSYGVKQDVMLRIEFQIVFYIVYVFFDVIVIYNGSVIIRGQKV